MRTRLELSRLAIFLLGTLGVLGLLLHFDVFERISFSMEKGRLRALHESLPSGERLDELTQATRTVAQTVAPAVVSIVTETVEEAEVAVGEPAATSRDPFARQDEDPSFEEWLREHLEGLDPEGVAPGGRSFSRGLGSGFIFDADRGHILTNSHVVDGADVIRVYLSDGREADAIVLGSDPDSDLAVIRIELARLHELPFGDSDAVAVGDDVLAVGNPFGLEGTFSKGIISAFNRRSVSFSNGRAESFLQTDAVINPGNSGGPLVNLRGEVVGINTAIATHTGTYDGVGFAIPARRAHELIDDLIDGGPGFLGVLVGDVTYYDERVRALRWDRPYGTWVQDVLEGLSADRAGVKPDDIIVSINDETIDTTRELGEVVSALAPDSEIELTVWRDGRLQQLPLRLGRRYAPR
jgi:S1-C subfamily serine protease